VIKKKQEKFYGLIGNTDPLGGVLNHELPNGHIVRVHLRTGPTADGPDGPEASRVFLQIYRQGGSYRVGDDRGLFFVAFGRYCQTFERMLQQMIGETVTVPEEPLEIREDGTKLYQPDKLLDFSKMLDGAYYYAPSLWCLYNWRDNPIAEVHEPEVHYFNKTKKVITEQ